MRIISPSEISEIPARPYFIMEAINNCIKRDYSILGFNITQEELIKEMLKLSPNGVKRIDLFQKGWLDIENLVRDAGWDIIYIKPDNEEYDSFFKFSHK